MCGIFGYIGQSSDAARFVFAGLKDIEYRGYDSWGISYLKDGKFHTDKEIGFLPRKLNFPDSTLALGHTRWATHGGVTVQNAHPHSDCTGKLTIVHNGIVENYEELKKELTTHKFKSDTDTEVIVHLIEVSYKKDPDLAKAVLKVFRRLKGLNAIVVSDGKKIVAAKIGSPVIVGSEDNALFIASDPNAILPFTRNLLFLEDNQLVSLGNKLEVFETKTGKKLESKLTRVKWEYSSASLNNYPHFMLKEIHEQPKVILNALQNMDQINEVSDMIKKAYGTYFIACGTASYSCLLGTYLFSEYAKRHVNFSIGSEFNYLQDFLTDKSLLIAVSQSGESIDTLEPVLAAKKKGTKTIALVNVLGSTLYRSVDKPLLLQAGVEKAVASTKAMIAMMSYMILLALTVADKKNEAIEIIKKSSAEVEDIIKRKKDIQKLAGKISGSKHMYVLGRGLSYAVALESALKIKEISYIHAEGFAGGELKHGTMALIEKGTPVLVFVPNDKTRQAALANAMEVKARGAFVIGVSDKNSPIFDYYFEVKDTGASSVIPNVVFAQLLSYYLAIKLNLNPDKPRNLAKSVVVR